MTRSKYLDIPPQQILDERDRYWYIKLGELTDLDIMIDDHGVMMLTGHFDFGGQSQGIQCIIDDPHPIMKKRLGTVFGSELIRQLIDMFTRNGLFSTISGKYYAMYDEEFHGMIRGIADPVNPNKYIIWKDVLEEVKGMDWTKDLKSDG